jgi:ribosome-associated toxin RatA of RatAB toxin-antitoxin module
MSTTVEKRILVNVPVSTAYNQWTQFEDFPQFMGGVKKVTQLSDDRLEWVAEIAGVKRQWEARILEQVPDRKVSWAATEGATNAGSVTFEDVGGGQTSIQLFLEYEPEGLIEKVGDKLNVIENQAEGDLERFKAFIESEGYASGAWRGSVNEGGAVGTPGVEHAAESRGDSGKAGVSGKVVAGAVGLAAAAAVGVAAAGSGKETDKSTDTGTTTDAGSDSTFTDVGTAAPTVPVTATTDAADLGTGGTDRAVGHPFDQTNGLADVDGESDGTAASDTRSAAERGTDDPLR